MKKISIFLMLILFSIGYSQVGPTLGIGLETLTMNKGTIDVEVLTKIIMEKQKELKKEALKRFMFKMFPDTNYTTRFYVQNSLNILLNEKNPQVIEKEILELTTNYAIALGVTTAYVNKKFTDITVKTEQNKIKQDIKNNSQNAWISFLDKKNSTEQKEKDAVRFDYDQIYAEMNNIEDNNKYLRDAYNKFRKFNQKFNTALKKEDFEKAKKLLQKRDNQLNKIKRIAYKKNIALPKNETVETGDAILTFGQNLDLVSSALSKNDKLRKKGFFKNKIDYTDEQPYFISEKEDTLRIYKINQTVDLYVYNYDIIKAFITDLDTIDVKNPNIFSVLKNKYSNQISSGSKISNILKNNNTLILNDYAVEFNELNSMKNAYSDFQKLFHASQNYLKELQNNPDFEKKYSNYVILRESYTKMSDNYLLITNLNNKYNVFDKNKIKIDFKNNDNKYKNIDYQYNELKKLSDTLAIKLAKKNIDEEINAINWTSIPAFGNETGKLDESIKSSINKITDSDLFFRGYLTYIISEIENNQYIKDQSNLSSNSLSEERQKISETISELYGKLSDLRKNQDYSYSDVDYIESQLLKKLIEAKNLAGNISNPNVYENLIDLTKNLTPLLKIKILAQRKLDKSNIRYDKELLTLFEFIGNLGRLDKADTYSSIIDLIRENNGKITEELPNGAFKESYKIFVNGIKKYTLINPNAEKEYVEIDVVSFLSDLQQYYDRNNPSKFSLYLTLGLNQNFFINKFQFPDSNEKISTVGFASEKIGVKYKLMDFKKFRGYENVIKSDVYLNKRSPFINEWYLTLYGSGLLYSLANTSTNQNFNFAHAGLATGLRFYNALDFNVLIGFPFVKNQRFGSNAFFGLGLDIPLGEYLEKLGSK